MSEINNAYPATIVRCQHIKVNGVQCGSPALKKGHFCYFHYQWHGAGRPPKETGNSFALDFPVLEDANALQVALMRVMDSIVTGEIDRKRSALLLYALQTAAINLPRTSFEPAPTEVVISPKRVCRTSLGAPAWNKEEFEQGNDSAVQPPVAANDESDECDDVAPAAPPKKPPVSIEKEEPALTLADEVRALYARQPIRRGLARVDELIAQQTQAVADPEKTGETPLGMTPWSASGQGHDPEEEDGFQHSAISHQPSGKPERDGGDDAEGNERELGAPQVSNAARDGASAHGESAGGGAAGSSWSEMSEAERECIRRAVDGHWPEEFEFRAPFSYLKTEPGQPLCPNYLARHIGVRMDEPGEGCEPGYRRCGLCKCTIKDPGGNGGEVVSGKPSQMDATLPG